MTEFQERPSLVTPEAAAAALGAFRAALVLVCEHYDTSRPNQVAGVTARQIVAWLVVLDRYLTRREPKEEACNHFRRMAREILEGEKVEVYLSDSGYSRLWVDAFLVPRSPFWLGGNSLDGAKERWDRIQAVGS